MTRTFLQILFGLFYFIFSNSAFSADTSEQKYFFNPESIEKLQQPEFQKYKDSTFKLFYKGSGVTPTEWCTNTMISDSGHYLTALHCISECLLQHEALTYLEKFRDTELDVIKDAFFGVDYNQIKGKKCLAIDSNTGEEIEVEFVASGPGTMLTGRSPLGLLAGMMEEGGPKFDRAYSFIYYGLAGNMDFAILKRTDENQPQSCVPVTKQKSSDYLNGQKLWTLSYPSPSRWEGDQLSDAGTQLYSEGQVLTNYVEDPELVKFANKFEFGEKADLKRELLFNFNGTKIAKIPATPGSSGAGIFDEQGELAGVVSFVVDPIEKTHPGATYFVSAAALRDYVEIDYKDDIDVTEVFNCTK